MINQKEYIMKEFLTNIKFVLAYTKGQRLKILCVSILNIVGVFLSVVSPIIQNIAMYIPILLIIPNILELRELNIVAREFVSPVNLSINTPEPFSSNTLFSNCNIFCKLNKENNQTNRFQI